MRRRFVEYLKRVGARLSRDERGGMAIFAAFAIIVLAASVGLGVDTVRGYMVQSRLSAALDAAGLAGARVMFSPTRDDDIRMYFDANFPAGFMGATIIGPNISVDADEEVLTLTAQATIDTSIMRLMGFDTLTVGTTSEITREAELLEVVLSIDMSGSMGSSMPSGGDRIDAARAAATELVNILFGSDETKPLLKIGVVPWNGKVNITANGVAFDSALTTTTPVPTFTNPLTAVAQSDVYVPNNSSVPLLAPPPADWKGCVFARYTDDAFANDGDLIEGPVTVGGAEWMAWEYVGPDGEPISPGKCPMAVDDHECTRCLSHGITALQNNKTTSLAAINELTSPTGTTDIPQGLIWAARVLLPGEPFTEADLNPPGNRIQAIVLLTDGQNFGGSGDGYKTVFGYGSAAGAGGADQRLRDLATALKAQDIVIYTIQFAYNNTALAQLMKDVASGPDAPFYHFAPDAATLQQVFKEVANDLSQLRVSR